MAITRCYRQTTFVTRGCQINFLMKIPFDTWLWLSFGFVQHFRHATRGSLLKWAYLTRPLNLKYPDIPGSSIFWYCVKNCAQIGICLIHIPLSCGSLHFVTASNKTNRPMGFRFYPFLSFLPQTEISRLLVTFSINYPWYETRYYGWWIQTAILQSRPIKPLVEYFYFWSYKLNTCCKCNY